MPLSQKDQGYSVAGSKSRPASTARPFPKQRVPSIYANAETPTASPSPQFSPLSDIKPGGSGSEPKQSKVGYHRAD